MAVSVESVLQGSSSEIKETQNNRPKEIPKP
jgi:hypothetical protein